MKRNERKKKLIYADDLMDHIQTNGNPDRYPTATPNDVYAFAIASVETAKEVDAVEVVRCKECIYYSKELHSCVCELHSEKPDCFNGGFDLQMLPNDFCSYGERRNTDE